MLWVEIGTEESVIVQDEGFFDAGPSDIAFRVGYSPVTGDAVGGIDEGIVGQRQVLALEEPQPAFASQVTYEKDEGQILAVVD
jgi:hypothetical protein